MDITEIYNKVYIDSSSKDHSRFMAIVEPYNELLLKINFANYDERYKTARLVSDYAINLYNEGFASKSLPYLNRAITLFDSDQQFINKQLLDVPIYRTLIWCRGDVYYNLKKYYKAKKDFKLLLTKWPENDRYKNWYNACIKWIYNRIGWIFLAFIVLYFIFRYVLSNEFEWDIILLIIGITGFVATEITKKIQLFK